MIAWRLCSRRFSDKEHILSGEGAKIYGGRWNESGLRLVYASANVSLALLEQLVHMSPASIPNDLVAVHIKIPADAPHDAINAADLPQNWRDRDNPDCVRIGSTWIREGKHLWLSVPSAVNPLEQNILLNPEHSDIVHCTLSEPIDVVYDDRLISLIASGSLSGRKTREQAIRRRLMGHEK